MLRQAIIGILRPKMVLSDRWGHLPHLLEHLLAYPARLERHGWQRRWHADRVIYQNAFINRHYEVEYAVVKEEYAADLLEVLKAQAAVFDFLPEEIERERHVIREEVAAGKVNERTMGEQFERTCLTSWSRRRPWDDRELREPLSPARLQRLARQVATEHYPFLISFDRCEVGDAPLPFITRNSFRDFGDRFPTLYHTRASAGRSLVLALAPGDDRLAQQPAFGVLLTLLRNPQFGFLSRRLRDDEGLLYSLSVGYSFVTSTLEIAFMYEPKEALMMVQRFIYLLSSEELTNWIRTHLSDALALKKMHTELEWGDIADHAGDVIGSTVITGDLTTASEYLKLLDSLSADEVIEVQRQIVEWLKSVRVVMRSYGKTIRTRWSPLVLSE